MVLDTDNKIKLKTSKNHLGINLRQNDKIINPFPFDENDKRSKLTDSQLLAVLFNLYNIDNVCNQWF